MASGLKIYQTRDFIKHTTRGTIDLERSLATVRQLATVAKFHWTTPDNRTSLRPFKPRIDP